MSSGLVDRGAIPLLRYRGNEEPTLFTFPHRTLHMSSFTKLLGPGVHVGFMLGNAALLRKTGKVAEDTYISLGYVAQGIPRAVGTQRQKAA
jgi:2-aminoadipate transaminase